MTPGLRLRRRAWLRGILVIAALAGATEAAADEANSSPLLPFRVVGDSISDALGGVGGDADRGRALVLARDSANCVLCHAFPDPGVRFSGNVGPSLGGIARTLSVAQLRLRVVDDMRVNPNTLMPSYYRTEGFDRVAGAYRGRPILDARQVENIVAYLATLK